MKRSPKPKVKGNILEEANSKRMEVIGVHFRQMKEAKPDDSWNKGGAVWCFHQEDQHVSPSVGIASVWCGANDGTPVEPSTLYFAAFEKGAK